MSLQRLATLARQEQAKRAQQAAFVPVFRAAALAIQGMTAFEIVIAGPAETGKTFAALYKVDRFLRDYPKSQGIILRQTRESVYTTVLRTFEKLRLLIGGVTVFGGQRPLWYDYANGSRLYVGGLDKPEKILSSEFDIIYVNQAEEVDLASWEMLTTRATGRAANAPYSMMLADCNPSNSTHWILSRPSLQRLDSFHVDNPTLYNDDGSLTDRGVRSLGILQNLTGVRKLRLYDGKWTNAEGAIYGEYDQHTHCIAHFEPPRSWQRFMVIDFGYTNPCVVQWWCMDGDGRLYMYREIYQTQTLVEDIARMIQRCEGWYQVDDLGEYLLDRHGRLIPSQDREIITARIADHDAEDRATLIRYGIDTLPAYKSVKLGIEAVQARMRPAGDGKPRIYFMRDSLVAEDEDLLARHLPTHTTAEIDGYVWAKVKDGKPIKEEPLKINDHGCDDIRYMVALVDNIGDELEDTEVIIIDYDPVSISPL